MKILVLGGTGFLGRYVVEQLIQQSYQPTILTRDPRKITIFSQKIPYIVGDLLNYHNIDFSPYTHIINCSGEINNEKVMHPLHVECIEGILNKLNKNENLHWLQVSSVGVYGKIRSGEVHENTPFAPIGQYEITKAEGELLVKRLCLKHRIKYTIIRPSNVFGIGMPNQSLAQLISILKRRLFFYIGKNTDSIVMNYVPVEDVARLITLCLEQQEAINQEFIISDQILLNDFVDLVCYELKIKNSFYRFPEYFVRFLALAASFIPRIPLTQARIDALTMRVNYSTAKAKTMLAFNPQLGSALALRNYISHYNNLV